MSAVANVGNDTFEEQVLKAGRPVLVDFWAPWCAPCRALAPIVEELADEFGDRVTFAQLNVDEGASLLVRYGIFGVPTIIVFKGGEPVEKIVGARPKRELRASLEKALAA